MTRSAQKVLDWPVFRLTLDGTRRLVLTDGLQLLGYMQRKGVAGSIGAARQGAFFRNMTSAALEEFVGECSLYTTTLQTGDLLYIPFGAVLGEQVQQVSLRVAPSGPCQLQGGQEFDHCSEKAS